MLFVSSNSSTVYCKVHSTYTTSDGLGTQNNPGFGFWKCCGEMGFKRQVEHGISSFFAIFLAYLMICQA